MNIVVACTGSVAVIETFRLVRWLCKDSHEVRVLLSKDAEKLVCRDLFSWASGHPVIVEDGLCKHLKFCGDDGWADVYLIAPATANTLSKMSVGVSDTDVTLFATTAIGAGKRVVVAPSMHMALYRNPAVAKSIETLKSWGVEVVPPKIEEGKAKMANIEDIHTTLFSGLPLSGKNVLVTLGPTLEFIDSVRTISNQSSGKMGLAIVSEAKNLGAKVTAIVGPCNVTIPSGVKVVPVTTTRDMEKAVLETVKGAEIFINCAAPSDYSPIETFEGKVDSSEKPSLTLELSSTPKISSKVRGLNQEMVFVGFKAVHGIDTRESIDVGRRKLVGDGMDFIVVNDVSKPGIGFRGDDNEGWIVSNSGEVEIPRCPKDKFAQKILVEVISFLSKKSI